METKNDTKRKHPVKTGLIGLGILIVLIIVLVILLKVFTKNKNISTNKEEMTKAGSVIAERKAIKDIETEASAGILKLNELFCNAKEVIDYSIVLVECTTTNKKVIEHYNSKKIYYTYLEIGENNYKHFISKNKEEAINKIKE